MGVEPTWTIDGRTHPRIFDRTYSDQPGESPPYPGPRPGSVPRPDIRPVWTKAHGSRPVGGSLDALAERRVWPRTFAEDAIPGHRTAVRAENQSLLLPNPRREHLRPQEFREYGERLLIVTALGGGDGAREGGLRRREGITDLLPFA